MRRSDFDVAEPLTLFDVEYIPASAEALGRASKQGGTSLFADEEE
jgi:hypothetical protein